MCVCVPQLYRVLTQLRRATPQLVYLAMAAYVVQMIELTAHVVADPLFTTGSHQDSVRAAANGGPSRQLSGSHESDEASGESAEDKEVSLAPPQPHELPVFRVRLSVDSIQYVPTGWCVRCCKRAKARLCCHGCCQGQPKPKSAVLGQRVYVSVVMEPSAESHNIPINCSDWSCDQASIGGLPVDTPLPLRPGTDRFHVWRNLTWQDSLGTLSFRLLMRHKSGAKSIQLKQTADGSRVVNAYRRYEQYSAVVCTLHALQRGAAPPPSPVWARVTAHHTLTLFADLHLSHDAACRV